MKVPIRTKEELEVWSKMKKHLTYTNKHEYEVILEALKQRFNKNQEKIDYQDVFMEFANNVGIKTKELRKEIESILQKTKSSLHKKIKQKFPLKEQRLEFYYSFLSSQILAELLLLNKLYSIETWMISNEGDLQEKRKFLYQKWYEELIINEIISDKEDLVKCNLDYENLEIFIFEICNARKMQPSSKERFELFKKETEEHKERKYRKITSKDRIYNYFNDLMKKGTVLETYGDILYYFDFKPYILPRILDLDGFLTYLKNNDSEVLLRRALSSDPYRELISNEIIIPDIEKISELRLYFHNISTMQFHFKSINRNIENNQYTLFDLELIESHLKSYKERNNEYFQWIYPIALRSPKNGDEDLKIIYTPFIERYKNVQDQVEKILELIKIKKNKMESQTK